MAQGEYKKHIDWSGMASAERLEEMRRIAREECLVDGKFVLNRSPRIRYVMKRFDVSVDEFLGDTEIEISEMIQWKGMTRQQVFDKCVELVKGTAKDGIIKAEELRSKIPNYVAKKVDLKAAMIAADVISLQQKKVAENAELILRSLEEISLLSERIILSELSDAKNLGELIATVVCSKNGTVKQEVCELFLNIKALDGAKKLLGLFGFADELLEGLGEERFDVILASLSEEYSIPASSNKKIDHTIKRLLFGCAASAGLYISAALEFADGKYVYPFIEAERKRIKAPVTVYEHGIMMFPEGLKNKTGCLMLLREKASVGPGIFGVIRLAGEDRKVRGILIEHILKPIQESGVKFGLPLLDKKLQHVLSIDTHYLRHLESKDNLKKEDRTLGWYFFEVIDVFLFRGNKSGTIYTAYKDFFNTRVLDLTKEDIAALRGHKRPVMLNEVLRKIAEDGLCSPKLFEISKPDEVVDPFDFRASRWDWIGGSFDFRTVDKTYETPIREYIKHKVQNKQQVRSSFILLMLEFFSLAKVPVLQKLSRESQMRFYLVLSRSMVDGTERSRNKAIAVLKLFRSFVKALQKLDKDLVSKTFKLDYSFRIKRLRPRIVTYTHDEQRAIVEFLEKDMNETDRYVSRLELCAFGLQMLLARRKGEIISTGEHLGLTVDAIYEYCKGEWMLKYYSPKQGKIDSVLLNDLVQERKGPFAEALIFLSLKLFNEAVKITSAYRHLLPEYLKDYLFVVPSIQSPKGLYVKMGDGFMSTKVKELFCAIGVDENKASHISRHTMATEIILSGGTVMDAAAALGDKSATVAMYYHEFTSRADTLKLFAERGRTCMVDSHNDSAYLKRLEENRHRVCRPSEMSPDGHRMAGGSCVETVEGRLKCPSYQMIRGAKGCVGCWYLEVNAVDNKAYWVAEVRATYENMEASAPESVAYEFEEAHNEAAKNILEDIEQKELEVEWGL